MRRRPPWDCGARCRIKKRRTSLELRLNIAAGPSACCALHGDLLVAWNMVDVALRRQLTCSKQSYRTISYISPASPYRFSRISTCAMYALGRSPPVTSQYWRRALSTPGARTAVCWHSYALIISHCPWCCSIEPGVGTNRNNCRGFGTGQNRWRMEDHAWRGRLFRCRRHPKQSMLGAHTRTTWAIAPYRSVGHCL